MRADLNSYSLNELKQLRKDVEKAISTFEERQRKEAKAALAAKAKEMGFSLNELTGDQKTTRSKLPPKYQHPENPEKTWTGRGRQPGWFKKALAAGKSPEDMEIK